MTNPIIAVYDEIRTHQARNEVPPDSIAEKFALAMDTGSEEDRKLAIAIVRGIHEYQKSYSVEGSRYTIDETEAFARHIESPILARVVALSHHWSNDLWDAALSTLGIEQPHFDHTQEAEKMAWWEANIEPLLDEKPADIPPEA